jgi:hypothetical protein
MDALELREFKHRYFETFAGTPVEASIELAQHLVLGALDYARELGFEPHPDFDAAAGHLGASAGPSDITFGRDGQPFFVPGPYDDAAFIRKTLNLGRVHHEGRVI